MYKLMSLLLLNMFNNAMCFIHVNPGPNIKTFKTTTKRTDNNTQPNKNIEHTHTHPQSTQNS